MLLKDCSGNLNEMYTFNFMHIFILRYLFSAIFIWWPNNFNLELVRGQHMVC